MFPQVRGQCVDGLTFRDLAAKFAYPWGSMTKSNTALRADDDPVLAAIELTATPGRGLSPAVVANQKTPTAVHPHMPNGRRLSHRECGDHYGTAHQRGCDPPQHQRLAGAGGSKMKR